MAVTAMSEAIAQLTVRDLAADETRRARIAVCDRATGAEDAADLMHMLGIHPRQEPVRSSAAMRKQPKPHCGTNKGYGAHRYRGEAACEPCLAAHRAYVAEHKQAAQEPGAAPRTPAPCGTAAGCQRHYRLGEKPCEACKQAHTDARRQRRHERGY